MWKRPLLPPRQTAPSDHLHAARAWRHGRLGAVTGERFRAGEAWRPLRKIQGVKLMEKVAMKRKVKQMFGLWCQQTEDWRELDSKLKTFLEYKSHKVMDSCLSGLIEACHQSKYTRSQMKIADTYYNSKLMEKALKCVHDYSQSR